MSQAHRTLLLAAVTVGAVVVIVGLTSCGQSSHHRASGPFAGLHPAAAPTGWSVARTSDGATLSYPPGWAPIKTDPGTASVALLGDGGRIDALLNLTPKQGSETLANWSRFRPEHNRGEGDRSVRLIASARDLTFRAGGRGSCVIDTYKTSKATYREIACLVSGPRSTAVVVAAATGALWDRQAATLERAASSFVP
jgi:hypothetical protein